MEEYSRLLFHFYRKAVSRHSQKAAMIRKLHAFMHRFQLTTNDNNDQSPNVKIQREENSRFHSKIGEQDLSVLQGSEKEWGLQWSFFSTSLQQTLFFAVLYRLIEAEDFLNFKCLQEKLNCQMEDCELEEIVMRAISDEWFKIGQILLTKNKVRWQKLLTQSVHSIPLEFNSLFANIFEGKSLYDQKEEEMLAEIAAQLKVKVNYWQLQGRKMVKSQAYGLGQQEINVCFLSDINKYIVCTKRPEQSIASKQKEDALSELRLGFSSLLQQYQQGTSNMTELSSLSGVKLNEWKVLAYLGKR